mgnify:CR=1 FL=1
MSKEETKTVKEYMKEVSELQELRGKQKKEIKKLDEMIENLTMGYETLQRNLVKIEAANDEMAKKLQQKESV